MIYTILIVVLILIDQVSKLWADVYIGVGNQMPIIYNSFTEEHGDALFAFTPTENTGAAFSLLSGTSWGAYILIGLSAAILIAVFVYLLVSTKRSKWLFTSIAFIVAGACGNLIDRIAFSSVRDFLDVAYFANFNVADIFICVGAVMLILFMLFIDRDALFRHKKKETEPKDDKSNKKKKKKY